MGFIWRLKAVRSLLAPLAGLGSWSNAIWAAVTLPVLAALLLEIVTSLRRGDVGLDIVAALSISAALAFGESLAAAIVAPMYAGGQFLDGTGTAPAFAH